MPEDAAKTTVHHDARSAETKEPPGSKTRQRTTNKEGGTVQDTHEALITTLAAHAATQINPPPPHIANARHMDTTVPQSEWEAWCRHTTYTEATLHGRQP